MWITLLVMALAVSLEPFRVGMTVLMLNRPRPGLQLAAFLTGGFLMGLSVGVVVLFAIESRLPKSAHFTLPKVQIVIGALALLVATFLALTRGRPRTPPVWLIRLLEDKFYEHFGITPAAVAAAARDWLVAAGPRREQGSMGEAPVTATSGSTAAATRLAAVLMFTVVAFALIEIPLLAYLVAPQRTHAVMTRLHHVIRARRRNEVATLLAVVGAVLLGVGLLTV